MSRTNYYPQLDSVRGLSFLAIFFFHAVHPEFGESIIAQLLSFYYSRLPFAIDVFFILSSFLLTWLGIKEYQKRSRVSLGKFFQRRVLRIWPLYFLFLTLGFFVMPVISEKAGVSMTLPDPLYYFLFAANFYGKPHVFFLQLLWTISVEEQFYVFLGFSMRFLFRYLQKVFLLLILTSIVFTVYAYANGIPYYFHTLTYCVDFAAGGTAALMLSREARLVMWTRKLKGGAAVLFYLWPLIQLTFFFLLQLKVQHYLPEILNRYLFIGYTGLLLVEQVANPNRCQFLGKGRFLVLTGKISFGLYCFHGLCITLFEQLTRYFDLAVSSWVLVPAIFAFNFGIALASYRFLERPFLRLKDRLRMI